MKLIKFLSLISLMLASTPSNATLITSTFSDNGIITTETRTNNSTGDITTFEWLDLTITNGLLYDSIVADISNNGILDNNANTLVGSNRAIGDVSSLTLEQASGWNTVSLPEITDMLSLYFDINIPHAGYTWIPHIQQALVDEFIGLFGNSYVEGYNDINNLVDIDVPDSPNHRHYSYGYINETGGGWQLGAGVVSSAHTNYGSDSNNIDIGGPGGGVYEIRPTIGTWLVREVQSVPEPSTLAIFTLGMIALALRRFKKQS